MCNKFEELYSINVNEKVETKNGFNYLSWAYAWAEFKKKYPNATYTIKMFDNKPYIESDLGYMVFTEVTAENLTHEMWLPVLDGANKPMKSKAYTYVDKYKKEKTVAQATMFDVNRTIMRCLVKNLAMFGLGLYIYAGEDLPEQIEEEQEKPQKTVTKPTTPINKHQEVKESEQTKAIFDDIQLIADIDKCNSIDDLAKYFKLYQNKVSKDSLQDFIDAKDRRKQELQEVKQ